MTARGSGRPNVLRAIVFETDGAANTVPASYLDSQFRLTEPHRDDVLRPCGSSVDYANTTIKPSGTLLFTVSYALSKDDDCYEAAHNAQDAQGKWVYTGYRVTREPVSAGPALAQMASPNGAFAQASEADMSAVFQKIANKLNGARLVPDDERS